MKTTKPRNQRKMQYNAPLHKNRKWLASHLSENLLLKYDKRSVPVITGDEVEVMRGSYKGHKDKVASVNVKKQAVVIEGITTVKADGTKIARSLHPSNLIITKLNLTDRWRRQKLERGLSDTTKKEIEKEAEQQIKQQKEEQKIAEEKRKAEEEAELEEETLEEEVLEEKPETTEKTSEKTEKEEEIKKPETKDEKPKQKTEVKPAQKKTEPAKKKTEEKAPSKPKEDKKEGEK